MPKFWFPQFRSPHLLTILPFILLLFTIVFASLAAPHEPLQPSKGQHAHVGFLAKKIDIVVRDYGPFLPFVLFAVQYKCLPYEMFAEKGRIRASPELPEWCNCCNYWNRFALLLWILMMLARLVLFLAFREYHYYFSDHIFLITSLLGMIIMKLWLPHLVHSEHHADVGIGSSVTFAVGWALVIMLLIESWVTAKYYHTAQADFTAWLCGSVLFGGMGLCFVWRMELPPATDDAPATNDALLPN